ncbi:MAG: adenosylmethionine decarboxylase [Minisyncoccus archaeiphilus]|jgi:S-adenosylmethionine decarboxylase|uniref:S-adenosylmethionine decarboxylase family protein n=1 Tax=Minisyncoccus archaeiphilus TaxID=3238481 RepID=UPI002B0DB161|nr:MAG: adenosylmethionine decarboxylase [Candidatus Parcubacteria bacterium]
MHEVVKFGEHFTIDGYEGNFDKLNNADLVKDCLNDLPEKLKMKKLAEPEVYFAAGDPNTKDLGGWSGFVVIAESHISIHTFPHRGFVSIDVYTCKSGMDRDFVSDYFIKIFDLKDIETNFIVRGTKYPVRRIYNV